MPGLGRPRHFTKPLLAGMPSWQVEGFEIYLIFYKPLSDGADVFRVIHGSKDIDAIFSE